MTKPPSTTPAPADILVETPEYRSGSHLPTVPAAPGERALDADYIRRLVHAQFAPDSPFEELLVEEIADLTRRMRQDEHRIGRILRARMRDIVEAELYRSNANIPDPRDRDGPRQRALSNAWAYGSPEDRLQAEAIITACGIEIEAVEARAWIASAKALDQLDRQIAANRRQRARAIEDLEALRARGKQQAIPDAEEVS
ncbi:hypothetical protein [Rhodovulum marinum]|uniref:Uncharacterized protein n=1 Tax=Rhodovulum marinum TaxID=320662 RepID=A0A4R2PYM1_9RHOB|nr:hypothetical protein [Rhodovulum marinum]TCP41260.1 hypothetical protein EV662_1054 [Rhodovulum marinum]